MAVSRRDHLVETALELFNAEGYHATGIDRILGTAGVAKMTLYKHFKSKDELILAALRRCDTRFRRYLQRGVEHRSDDPRAQLVAIFDVLGEWIRSHDFHGCMFINAAAEYGDPDHPIHRAATDHKNALFEWLRGLAEAAGAARPGDLAAQLLLLTEGATVTAQVNRQAPAAQQAKKAARALIDAALANENAAA